MKRIKKHSLLILIGLFTVVISCDEIPEIDAEDPLENDTVYSLDTIAKIDTLDCDTVFTCHLSEAARVVYDELLDAFENNDESALQNVLDDWNERYEPLSIIPDSLEDLYAVYKEFYSPWDLARIGDSEFGNDIYEGISHYIIQSAIHYNYSFRGYDSHMVIVDNFRPTINNDQAKMLYLREEYEAAINCFLFADNRDYDLCYSVNPPFSADEAYARARFIGKYLRFFHGHWGNYYHLETHPEVSYISFNETKDSAQVDFRIGYQGGEAIMGKDEEGWNIVDHYMTWIE